MAHEDNKLLLPIEVYGLVEVRRLSLELESLDEFLRQSVIREPGKQPPMPQISRLLDSLASDNSRNLLKPEDRAELMSFLESVENNSPTIHISFASDPSADVTRRLTKWLRGNIHASIILKVGLQPRVTAGCIVRTPSKTFDFSLRQKLAGNKSLLNKILDDTAAKQSDLVAQQTEVVA